MDRILGRFSRLSEALSCPLPTCAWPERIPDLIRWTAAIDSSERSCGRDFEWFGETSEHW